MAPGRMSIADRISASPPIWQVVIWLLFALCGVAAIMLAAAVAANSGGSDVEGVIAAGPCIDAVQAIGEYANGTRSLESTIAALQSAEGPERDAANSNPKYLPIAQAIVGAQTELANGDTGPSVQLLIRECRTDRLPR